MGHLIPRCSPFIPRRLLTRAARCTVRDLGETHLRQSPHTPVEEHIILQEQTADFLARNLPPVKPSWQARAVFIASGCMLAESPVSCSFPLLERTRSSGVWLNTSRGPRLGFGVSQGSRAWGCFCS